MAGYLTILAIAAIPAFAVLVGGLLAEVVAISRHTLSLALHFAAGMLFGVIGVEIMPGAMEIPQPWIAVLAFTLGGLFFIAVDWLSNLTSQLLEMQASGSALGILFGIALDVFTDGLMIASGSALGGGLGWLLGIAIALADLPEGFATAATFKVRRTRRFLRILLIVGLAAMIPLGALIGYWLLRDQSRTVNVSVLTFTAGILLVLVIEEMVPEAHRAKQAHLATVLLIAGFASFALLSLYLG